MIKILFLEDDELFCETLIDFLEESNYNITHVSDGEEFLVKAYESTYQLYLLDINVPKLNGLDTLKNLRDTNNNTPAIFLTSYKDKETLKSGFRNGCDDFLSKPFDMDELLLRIQSLLKRSNIILNRIKINDIIFDPKSNALFKDNDIIESSAKVIELFKLCFENNHNIVSKDMIIDRLWEYGDEYSEGSLRVYISKLQKIFTGKHITNIKNVGYKIEF